MLGELIVEMECECQKVKLPLISSRVWVEHCWKVIGYKKLKLNWRNTCYTSKARVPSVKTLSKSYTVFNGDLRMIKDQ